MADLIELTNLHSAVGVVSVRYDFSSSIYCPLSGFERWSLLGVCKCTVRIEYSIRD